jgi:hypothetical protein
VPSCLSFSVVVRDETARRCTLQRADPSQTNALSRIGPATFDRQASNLRSPVSYELITSGEVVVAVIAPAAAVT